MPSSEDVPPMPTALEYLRQELQRQDTPEYAIDIVCKRLQSIFAPTAPIWFDSVRSSYIVSRGSFIMINGNQYLEAGEVLVSFRYATGDEQIDIDGSITIKMIREQSTEED